MGAAQSLPEAVCEHSMSYLNFHEMLTLSLGSKHTMKLVIQKFSHLEEQECRDICILVHRKVVLQLDNYFSDSLTAESGLILHDRNMKRLLKRNKHNVENKSLYNFIRNELSNNCTGGYSPLHGLTLRKVLDSGEFNDDFSRLFKDALENKTDNAISKTVSPQYPEKVNTPIDMIQRQMYDNRHFLRYRWSLYRELLRPVCACCGVLAQHNTHCVCQTCFVVDPWYNECAYMFPRHSKSSLCSSCYQHARKHVMAKKLPAIDSGRNRRIHAIVSKALSQIHRDWSEFDIARKGEFSTPVKYGRLAKKRNRKFENVGTSKNPILLCDENLDDEGTMCGMGDALCVKYNCPLSKPSCLIHRHRKGPDSMLKYDCNCSCHV